MSIWRVNFNNVFWYQSRLIFLFWKPHWFQHIVFPFVAHFILYRGTICEVMAQKFIVTFINFKDLSKEQKHILELWIIICSRVHGSFSRPSEISVTTCFRIVLHKSYSIDNRKITKMKFRRLTIWTLRRVIVQNLTEASSRLRLKVKSLLPRDSVA